MVCNNHHHYWINFLCLLFHSNLDHQGRDTDMFIFYWGYLLVRQDDHKSFFFLFERFFFSSMSQNSLLIFFLSFISTIFPNLLSRLSFSCDYFDQTCFVSVLNVINQIWIIVVNQVIFVFDFYIIGKNTSCRLFWYTLLVFYWIISWKKSTILIRSRTLKFLSFRYWNIISF